MEITLVMEDKQKSCREFAKQIMNYLRQGCGDSSCFFGIKSGMETNGGCRCIEHIEDLLKKEREEYRIKFEETKHNLEEAREALAGLQPKYDELVKKLAKLRASYVELAESILPNTHTVEALIAEVEYLKRNQK